MEGRAISRKVICFTRLVSAFSAVGDVERAVRRAGRDPERHQFTVHAAEVERVRGELLLLSGERGGTRLPASDPDLAATSRAVDRAAGSDEPGASAPLPGERDEACAALESVSR
jgi:hypothetical protein